MTDPQYRKAYNRGWKAAQNPKETSQGSPLERADLRGESQAWYDGYYDYAADRERWETARARDAADAADAERAAGAPEAPEETGDATPAAGTRTPAERPPLVDAVDSGVAQREMLGEGSQALVELVTFNDGSRAVHKRYPDDTDRPDQADAEELVALVADALGVTAPRVHRSDQDAVFMDYMPGQLAAQLPPTEQDRLVNTDAGRLIGLLDVVVDNQDRHQLNWLVEGGEPVAIDHGLAFRQPSTGQVDAKTANAPGGIFAAHFTLPLSTRPRDNAAPGADGWRDNDLTPADVAEARRRLEALRGEFDRLDRGEWLDQAQARLDQIGARAKGTRNRLAAADVDPGAGDETDSRRAELLAAPPPIVYAPTDGVMATLDPLDRERIRVAVEDNAGRVARTPFMSSSVARYVAEGSDLRDVTERYGLATVANAVRQVLDQRPELAERDVDEVELAQTRRRGAAQAATDAADTAIEAGDFAAARAALDEGERIDPTFSLPVPGGPPMDWPAMRELVDEIERERAGDTGDAAGDRDATGATPAAGTSTPAAGAQAAPVSIDAARAARRRLGNDRTEEILGGHRVLAKATPDQLASLVAAADALDDQPVILGPQGEFTSPVLWRTFPGSAFDGASAQEHIDATEETWGGIGKWLGTLDEAKAYGEEGSLLVAVRLRPDDRGRLHEPSDVSGLVANAAPVDVAVVSMQEYRDGGWHNIEVPAGLVTRTHRDAESDEDPDAVQPDDMPGEARPAGTTAPAGDAGPPVQLDITGGAGEVFDKSRGEVGMAERPEVGRVSVFGRDQQLGLFADESRQMAGQEALLDALLAMPAGPASEPPPADLFAGAGEDLVDQPDTTPAAAPPAPASIVPADLSGHNDEQLAELFRRVSDGEGAAPGGVDEAGLGRIAAEWERREQAMAELVAAVPEDLTALSDDDLERMFAEVTSAVGTLDNAAADRMMAELERRTAAERQAREDAPKRALLARPVGELTDDEIEIAAGYAADLADEAALVRVYGEWERREAAEQAAAAAAQAEREAREAAEREQARLAAQAAEYAAAAAQAEAARQRSFDALGAAHTAAIVPPLADRDVNVAVGLLDEQGMRQVMGDAWVNTHLSEDRADLNPEARRGLLMTAARDLPPGDKVRVLFAAADKAGAEEFQGMSDAAVSSIHTSNLFSTDEEKRLRARRAGREHTLRKLRELRRDNVRAFRQAQVRADAAPVDSLTDAELEVAPALVTVDNPDAQDVIDRLAELRAEILRRQAAAGERAEQRAAGPAAPARYRDPMQTLGLLLIRLDRPTTPREHEARERFRNAQRAVYGLSPDAPDKDIRAAQRKDPRPVVDQATAVLSWYRHFAEYDDIGETPQDWMRGYPDDPDVPDTPDPAPPANVSKADEVWDMIKTNAHQEFVEGRRETAVRLLRAIGRTYRIPVDDGVDNTKDGIRGLQARVGLALAHDKRPAKVRAADFLAQFRVLAAEDGVDPADTLRYGPPDRVGRKPAAASFRESTPAQQKRIDELIGRGWDYLDAYAEVHGADPEALRRSQAGSDREIRQAYAEHVELQFRTAEQATAGNLLSKQAAARGVDARSLFSGSWTTARARASEELLRFWADNPRMTYADFKASLLGGAEARAARERMITAGKGNQFA